MSNSNSTKETSSFAPSTTSVSYNRSTSSSSNSNLDAETLGAIPKAPKVITVAPPKAQQTSSLDASRSTSSFVLQIFHRNEASQFVCPLKSSDYRHVSKFAASTTPQNLLRHLERQHPKDLEAFRLNSQQNSLTEYVQSIGIQVQRLPKISNYCTSIPDNSIPTSHLYQAWLVIHQNLSFLTLDSTPFTQMLLTLGSESFAPISSFIFTQRILPIFVQVIETRIQSMLKSLLGVCISFDGWADNSNVHYLGVCVHFVEPESWIYHEAILGVIPMKCSLTSENLNEAIDAVIERFFGKETIVAATVTDGAANMLSTADYLVGRNDRIHCIDHVLNLLINQSLGEIQVELDMIRTYVQSVKKSHNLLRIFLDQQQIVAPKPITDHAEDLEEETVSSSSGKLNLIVDCPTRWGSTFLMLSRFLALFPVLTSLESHPDWDLHWPSFDRDFLEMIRSILEQMFLITKAAQSAHFPTAGFLPIWVVQILDHLDTIKRSNQTGRILRFIDRLRAQADERLRPILTGNGIPLQISCLIPSFGGLQMKYFDSAQKDSIWSALSQNIYEILKVPTESSPDVDSELDDDEEDFVPSASSRFILSQTSSVLRETIDNELGALRYFLARNQFKGEKLAESCARVSPLKLWMEHDTLKKLMNIRPAVQVMLGIPGSSARIESAFSLAGILKSSLRNRMSPERVEDVLFVRLNVPKLFKESEFISKARELYSPRIPFSSSLPL